MLCKQVLVRGKSSSWNCLEFLSPEYFPSVVVWIWGCRALCYRGLTMFSFPEQNQEHRSQRIQPGLSCHPSPHNDLQRLGSPAQSSPRRGGSDGAACEQCSRSRVSGCSCLDRCFAIFFDWPLVFCLSKVFFLKRKVLIATLCLTLCVPMDCSSAGSSVHEILQARLLEWVAIAFSRGIFLTQGSNPHLLHCRQILYPWATGETHKRDPLQWFCREVNPDSFSEGLPFLDS